MKISEVIKESRLKQGLTQEQLANYLMVSTPTVNKWEKAVSYPDITLLAPSARILKIDVKRFLCKFIGTPFISWNASENFTETAGWRK